MPETTHCPACQKRFRLPDDLLGRSVKCPDCGAVFTAPGRPAEAEPADAPLPFDPVVPRPVRGGREAPFAEDVPSARREADGEVWRTIAAGASLHGVAHALYVGALALLFVIALAALGDSSPSSGTGFGRTTTRSILAVFGILAGLALLGNWLLAVIAESFWVLAPVQAKARGLAIALLVMGGLVLLRLPQLVGLFIELVDRRGGRDQEAYLVSSMLLFYLAEGARLTLFGFFLGALARNLRRPGLAGTNVLGLVTPLVLGGLFLLTLVVLLAARREPAAGLLVLFLNVAGQAGLLIWGLMALLRIRQVLQPRSREED
jgi:predicted Zn finger-like uncharacterized protein